MLLLVLMKGGGSGATKDQGNCCVQPALWALPAGGPRVAACWLAAARQFTLFCCIQVALRASKRRFPPAFRLA